MDLHAILYITCCSLITGFDVEDLAVDVAYWFDKNTKRKAGLQNSVPFVTQHIKKLYLMFLQDGQA